MGMSGHMLGAKQLRALNRITGMDFDCAARRGQGVSARRMVDSVCEHYEGRWGDTTLVRNIDPIHWVSCPEEMKR